MVGRAQVSQERENCKLHKTTKKECRHCRVSSDSLVRVLRTLKNWP